MGRLATLFILLSATAGFAQNLQENFLTRQYDDTANTTAVWNQVLGYIHSPLAISLTNGQNNQDSLNADVGDGSNGNFDASTYAQFSVGGNLAGNVITINTDTYPVLQFTNFNLESGWQIEGIGSNPLWIKVLGSVTIAGTINCSGANGQSTSTNLTVASQGGLGYCGGGTGGAGATSVSASQAGFPGGTSVTGGAGGTTAATGTGGGGGGGYSLFTGSNGYVGGATTGGAAGTNFTDSTFSIFGSSGIGGGSGGGGGGYSTGTYSGGGGGAGGGVIRIVAIGNITITGGGAILARAGSGGGGVGGAGGGGGSGGGIWLQTPGVISNSGVIDASAPTSSPNGGIATNNGGFGTNGRTWLTSSQSVIQGNPENPQSDRFSMGPCFCAGEIHYSVAAYQAQTLSYDLRNTNPTAELLTLVNSLPAASTATVLAAGSDDNFVTDNTGFLPTSQLAMLTTKRYVKFQLQLQLNNPSFASTPAAISQINYNYLGFEQNQFNLTSACGTMSGPGELAEFLLLLAVIYFLTSGRLRKAVLGLQKLWLA